METVQIKQKVERNIALERRLGELIVQMEEGQLNLKEMHAKAREAIGMHPNLWNGLFSNVLVEKAYEAIQAGLEPETDVSLETFRDCLLGRQDYSFTRKIDGTNYRVTYIASQKPDVSPVEVVEE